MPEPEERFAMDEYSDTVAVSKPTVYITVGELVNTHRVRGRNLGVWAGGRAVGVHDGWGADPWSKAWLRPCLHAAAVAGAPGLDRS